MEVGFTVMENFSRGRIVFNKKIKKKFYTFLNLVIIVCFEDPNNFQMIFWIKLLTKINIRLSRVFCKRLNFNKYENDSKKDLFQAIRSAFQSPFDKLFGIFKELITHTSGDFDEAIDWLEN
jgi:hypothetical protein